MTEPMTPAAALAELSERDRALLTAAAAGKTAAQTARLLDLSESRVHHLRGDLVRAVGAQTWTRAVALAVDAGVITVPPVGGGDR